MIVLGMTPAQSEEPKDSKDRKSDADISAPVGLAGDARRIVVEGATAFEPLQVRGALAGDLIYQAAARPSSELQSLVDTTQRRVLAGYQHAGYIEANVSAAYDGAADHLVVEVGEGDLFRAGGIRITGAVKVDAKELAARLQRPAPSRNWVYHRLHTDIKQYGDPTRSVTALNSADDDSSVATWMPGEPLRGDEDAIAQVRRQVTLHLADLGFPLAQFSVRMEPKPGPERVADLLIDIRSEGSSATIGSIRVKGLTRHAEQQLLDYLSIRQGMPLNAVELERIYQTLRDSCRFWRYAVFVRFAATEDLRYGSNGAVDLGITVEEYDRVPMLDEPLSETDEILVRASRWLQQYWTSDQGEELVIWGTAHSPADREDAMLSMRAVISRQRGCIIESRGEYQGIQLDAAALYAANKLSLFDWRSGKKLTGQGVGCPRFTLEAVGGGFENGEYKARMVMGAGMGSENSALEKKVLRAPGRPASSRSPLFIWRIARIQRLRSKRASSRFPKVPARFSSTRLRVRLSNGI